MEFSDEICFPRGGKLHPKQKQKLYKEKATKIKKEEEDNPEDLLLQNIDEDETTLFNEVSQLEDTELHQKDVQHLTLKNIRMGMLFLGCVLEIKHECLLVSLPNCLMGKVPVDDLYLQYAKVLEKQSLLANEQEKFELSNVFKIGQLIVCSVLQVNMKSSEIKLSLDPTRINSKYEPSKLLYGMHISGFVKSVEDHGYIVDIGMEDVHAFAPFSSSHGNTVGLKKFQVIRCFICNVKNNGKALILSADPTLLIKPMMNRFGEKRNAELLLPGTIVRFISKKELPEGMLGRVGSLTSSLSSIHMPAAEENEISEEISNEPILKNSKHDFQKEKNINNLQRKRKRKRGEVKYECKFACVLYSIYNVVVVSTNSQIWKESPKERWNSDLYEEKYKTGQKYTATVVHKVPDLGLLCQLQKHGKYGIIKIADISDEDCLSCFNDTQLSSKLKVRITNNMTLDDVFELSSKKSLYETVYYSHNDLRPGDDVHVKVLEYTKLGLRVAVGSRQDKQFVAGPLTAMVPAFHISDIILKHPEKVFHVGKMLTCKVLAVDPEHRFITLTNKQTLVLSELPIITSYDRLNKDDVIHVYIKAIKPQGCVVGYYSNIQGFVPDGEIKLLDPGLSVEDEYFPGQVVRARVLRCDPADNKLVLSFFIKDKRKHNT